MVEFHVAASVLGSYIVHAVSLSHCHGLLGHLNSHVSTDTGLVLWINLLILNFDFKKGEKRKTKVE